MLPDRLLLCLNESLKVYSIPVLTLTFDLHMLPVDNVLRLYMTLYILDNIPAQFQTHTIHISSVTVDQTLALKQPIWNID